jgi:Zn finger protein HypA/HybF involved in hydrogenase expression
MSHEHVYVDAIVGEAKKHGDVEAITVEVGKLAPIPAEELEKALSFTGWTIEIVENPGRIHCACGYKGAPEITDKGHDYTIYNCPQCNAPLPPIIDGKEVILKDVTIK